MGVDTAGEPVTPRAMEIDRLRETGRLALTLHEFGAAETAFGEALGLVGDGPTLVAAELYEGLADVWERSGREDAALQIRGAAQAIRRRVGPSRPDVDDLRAAVAALRESPDAREQLGVALNDLVLAQLAEGLDADAIRANAEESLAIGREFAPESVETAVRGALLVPLLVRTGERSRALELGDELPASLRTAEPAMAGQLLRTMAQLRLEGGDVDGAARDADEAVAAATESGSPSMRAAALSVRGWVSLARDAVDDAAADCTEALELFASVREVSSPMAATLARMAEVESTRGDAEEAGRLLSRAVEALQRCAPNGQEHVDAVERLARHLSSRGDYVGAAARFRAAATAAGPGARKVDLMIQLGNVEKEMREFADAHRILSAALADAEELGDESLTTSALISLGGAQRWLRDFEGAEQSYQRVLDRSTNVLDRAQAIANLGGVRHEDGRYPAALACYREAIALFEGRDSSAAATITLNLATTLHEMGEFAQADLHYAHARQAIEGISRGQVTAAVGRARIAIAEERLDDAITHMADAIELLETIRRTGGDALFAEMEQHYGELLALLERRRAEGDDAWGLRLCELTRARQVDDERNRARASAPRSVEAKRIRARLAAVSRRRATASADSGLPAYLLADLERQERELEDELQDLDSGSDPSQPSDVLTATEIARELPPATLLLEFAVVGPRMHVWAVTRDSLELSVLPVDIETLGSLVAAALSPCHFPRDDDEGDESVWRVLGDAVLEPVRHLLGAVRALLVSPAGPLHYVPFEPFVEGPRVIYVPSATVALRRAPERQRVRHYAAEFVGFGNPSFDRSLPEFAHLDALPGAEFEVREIAAMFGERGVALCGADAAEPELRSWARRCRYLHIATHGLPDLENPMRSGLVLSSPHGVAVTGTAFDDVLYGYEMLDLQIEAELVVCAACYSGFGAIQAGEGMASLGAALVAGGARWVLVSLWRVGDRVTAMFTLALYRALLDGADIPAAVDAARAEVRGRHRHPRWWAPFILIGAEYE